MLKVKMKVLMISWFFPPSIGGIPSLLNSLLNEWKNEDILFSLLSNQSTKQSYENVEFINSDHYIKLRSLVQTYQEIEYKSWQRLEKEISYEIKLLADELKGYLFDIVFSHTDGIIAHRISKCLGIPCLLVHHGLMPTIDEFIKLGNTPVNHYRWIMNETCSIDEPTVFVSEWSKRKWQERGLSPKESYVIHNPIDFELFHYHADATELRRELNIPESSKIILCPQRINKTGLWNQIENLIEIASEESCFLIICGEKNDINYSANSNIRIKCFKYQEMPYVYSLSDVAVLPASDTFGLPLIEALACGTPAVCNTASAYQELIRNNKHDFKSRMLFYRTKEELHFSIVKSLQSKTKKDCLLSVDEINQYRVENIAKQYMSIIKNYIYI